MARDRVNPQSVAALFNDISVTLISDALDRLGATGAVAGVLPLWPGCPKVCGPARTLKLSLEATGSTVIGTLEAVQASAPGEVLVIDNGGRPGVNSFGGIAAFSARHQGMAGCVIDGCTRDVDEMQALNFPVYGRGIVQTSVRQRIFFEGYDMPVNLGGVDVHLGDYIFGDVNGVVVVPRSRVKEVLEVAHTLQDQEQCIRRDIARGVPPVEAHKNHRYEQPAP